MADELEPQDTDEQDEDLTLDDEQPESESSTDDDAPAAEAASGEPESKRINDLMSKWQKADAENARLKRELAKSKVKNPSGDSTLLQSEELMEFAREQARNSLYATDPRLARYKIPVESIAGDTPAEMRKSLEAQIKVVAAMETQIRRDIMLEHGIDPEVVSGGGGTATDFASMSSKDFNELIERRSRF